jgi:hypothetical protein
VYVAASTGCFPELSFTEAIEVLGDLEFTTVEIELNDRTDQIPPRRIVEEFDEMLRIVRDTHRLDICSYNVKIDATGDVYYERFEKFAILRKLPKS